MKYLQCSLLLFLQAANITNGQSAVKPNIILILVDDLGYGDVNLRINSGETFSNPFIQTPQLAGLASESLVYTSHYAASPVCSPSRAGLLTGRTPTRCNINQYINDKRENEQFMLHGSEITIAEILKSAGYSTGIFGKWHLNGADWEVPEYWTGWTGSFPKQQGFDHGIVTKEDPHFTRLLNFNSQKHPGDFFSVDGKPLGPIKGYSSDIISKYASDWIGQQVGSKKPFFAFLSYDAVHIRVAAADRFEAIYDTGNPRRDAYYANITHLDDAIGQVLDLLDRLKIENETIVIFTSDNGPDVWKGWDATYFCHGTSYPLKGQKYQLYEGGIRVPGMVRWPGKIKPGRSNTPNSTLDLLPTICELTGQPLPGRAIDGASLLKFWTENKPIERVQPLYWQYENSRTYDEIVGVGYERKIVGKSIKRDDKPTPKACVHSGDYVLMGYGLEKFAAPTEFILYNVAEDPEQKDDISKDNPEVCNELKTELLRIHQSAATDRIKTEKAISKKLPVIIF